MPDYLIKEETLTNIAKAIRSETGTTAKIAPDDMDTAISNIVTLSEGTADATAVAADLLSGKTAYVNGSKVTGTMTNNGAVSQTLNADGSYTIPAGYHNGSGKVTANSLASQTDGDATAANILSGKIAYVDGAKITGTMANQGAKTSALNCGGSYIIPAGYHNGSGKITANSLASQTSATATAANIASGKTAWVNGTKLTGTLSGGTIKVTSTTVENSGSGEFSYTAPTGRTLFKDCFPIPLFETYYSCRSTSRSGSGTRPLEPTISGNTITWPSQTVYITGLVTTPYYKQYVSGVTVYFIDVTI